MLWILFESTSKNDVIFNINLYSFCVTHISRPRLLWWTIKSSNDIWNFLEQNLATQELRESWNIRIKLLLIYREKLNKNWTQWTRITISIGFFGGEIIILAGFIQGMHQKFIEIFFGIFSTKQTCMEVAWPCASRTCPKGCTPGSPPKSLQEPSPTSRCMPCKAGRGGKLYPGEMGTCTVLRLPGGCFQK